MPKDYIVKDIALAEFGRKELVIAETEMPGLWRAAKNSAPPNPSPVRGLSDRCI